jgi:WD40 repeat protein
MTHASLPTFFFAAALLGIQVDEPKLAERRFKIEHRETIKLDEGTVRSVAFSPDTKRFAVGVDRTLYVFDVKTGERLHRLEGHTELINSVAFSPDGGILASGSQDKTIRLWEATFGKLLKVLTGEKGVSPQDEPITCVAFFLDGKKLASCGTNNYVTFWDIATGLWEHKAWTYHRKEDGCIHLAISQDSKTLAVAGTPAADGGFGSISVYSVDHGIKYVWTRPHDRGKPATHVSFSSDGKKVLSCGADNTMRVWDTSNGTPVANLSDIDRVLRGAILSRDGTWVVSATSDGTIQIWDVHAGKVLQTSNSDNRKIRGLAIASDESVLAIWGEDNTVSIWKVSQTGQGLAK